MSLSKSGKVCEEVGLDEVMAAASPANIINTETLIEMLSFSEIGYRMSR